DQTELDEDAEGDAWFRTLALGDLQRVLGKRRLRVEPCSGGFGVSFLALDADETPAEPLGDDRGRARAEKRVEHHIARVARREDQAVQQRFGLLRRVGLPPAILLQPLCTRADR